MTKRFIGTNGLTYVLKVTNGKRWWYVERDGGLQALSGEPCVKLKEI